MTLENIEPLITSYVDGELKDTLKKDEIKSLIEKNEKLNFDYKTELFVKLIISDKLKIKPVPKSLKNKVIRKINPGKKFLAFFFTRILF